MNLFRKEIQCKCHKLYAVLHHANTVWSLDISVTISYFYKVCAEMNSGMHDRLSKNWFREIEIIFKKSFFYKKMFQGPKGYIAQMC